MLLAFAVLVLAGCGGASSEDSTSGSSAAAGAAKEGGASGSDAGKQQGSPSAATQGKADGKGTEAGEGPGGSSPSPSAPDAKVKRPKGEPEPPITPQQRSEATVASIELESPALQTVPSGVDRLPAANTCDGADSSPEIRWKGVPAGTQELVLFAMNSRPVAGKIFFDWAVAGIDPTADGLEAGKLPRGAVIGQNSFGQAAYSICPPQGTSETYIFALYAVPQPLGARKGFDPKALRQQAGELAGNGGLMAAAYSR